VRIDERADAWLFGWPDSTLICSFEFLAFTSDVSHWRKKDKDLVGVSLRTILTNCVVQLIIMLYLQDSSTEWVASLGARGGTDPLTDSRILSLRTSWVILLSQASGLMIEFWKVRSGPAL
jgi:hypothetical protein